MQNINLNNNDMSELKITSDAIEKHFCIPFENLVRVEMEKELFNMMLKLLLSLSFNVPEEDQPFLMKVILKRVEVCFDYKLDHKTAIFLCMLCEAPGNAIMYLTYMQYWCKQNNFKEIDFNLFCEKIFPMGFPTKQQIDILWYNCKIHTGKGSDNLLDYPEALESIRFLNVLKTN